MNAEDLFLQKYGNKITASESWVIRFAEEYAKLKVDAVLRQPDVISSVSENTNEVDISKFYDRRHTFKKIL